MILFECPSLLGLCVMVNPRGGRFVRGFRSEVVERRRGEEEGGVNLIRICFELIN